MFDTPHRPRRRTTISLSIHATTHRPERPAHPCRALTSVGLNATCNSRRILGGWHRCFPQQEPSAPWLPRFGWSPCPTVLLAAAIEAYQVGTTIGPVCIFT